MATILAFAGSNSATSINFKLATFTATQISEHDVEVVDMSKWTFPMYGEDDEKEHGFPEEAVNFMKKIAKADAVILSVNEHNGYVSAYFKNLLDWLSRINRSFLEGKPVFLLATSPGKRGAIGSLEAMASVLPRFGGDVAAIFSLPSFYDNLKESNKIVDSELSKSYKDALKQFSDKI
ncbi:MAG: NAD(P)H-dependent oxidoreductase [Cellulophaga sp.]